MFLTKNLILKDFVSVGNSCGLQKCVATFECLWSCCDGICFVWVLRETQVCCCIQNGKVAQNVRKEGKKYSHTFLKNRILLISD